MIDKNFDPWKRVREFNPEALLQESSDLVQWPIKLYKAPKLSPYYHHGHLLIAADCSAFSACATAVAACLTGRSGRKSRVEMDGGTLEIEWNEQNGHIMMTGPAVTVFEGDILLPTAN